MTEEKGLKDQNFFAPTEQFSGEYLRCYETLKNSFAWALKLIIKWIVRNLSDWKSFNLISN